LNLERIVEIASRTARGEIGVNQFEIFGTEAKILSVYVDDGSIKSVEEKFDRGIAVRIAKGKRIGQSASTCDGIKDAERCVRLASDLATVSPEDRNFEQFSAGGQAVFSPKVYDEQIELATPRELAGIASSIVGCCTEKGKVEVPLGLLRISTIELRIVNSNGVDASHKSTMLYLRFTAKANDKAPGEGIEEFYSTHLSDVDPFSIGKSLKEGAKASARAVPFKGRFIGETVLTPANFAEMLLTSVGHAIDGENVHRKRSAWANKINDAVASSQVTIVDDPSDGKGILSAPFDDEGTPTSKKTIVEKGILKQFIYDFYTATLEGVKSSGNGMRRNPTDAHGIYRTPVSISPINLVLVPGNKSRESLISSVDDGILIERVAAPEVNPINGAFAMEVRCASVIKQGEIIQRINHALLVGNMFEALRKIGDIANDSTVVKSCIVPTVSIESLELIGGK
jgi:PmbA protein